MMGKKIFHELRSSPVAGSMVVRMSRNPREHIPSRNIKMDYHAKRLQSTVLKGERKSIYGEKLELTAIYVHESGKKGTEWFLLTTVTVKSEKEIEKLVQCYAHRWKIERFHFILKSGCKIEKEPGKGIWEIKLSNVIMFCHCNADIKSDLSWENMSGNFKWDRIC